MSLLLALTSSSPDVTSTLAFTTDDITFSGAVTETISSTLAFTTDDVTFAGTVTETISSTLAFTTDDVEFSGEINVLLAAQFSGFIFDARRFARR